MGYSKHVFIENKVFILALEGGNFLSITERSRKVTKELVFNLSCAHWMANMVEECYLSMGRRDFFKSFRIGSLAVVAHRRSNAFGQFLEVMEYGDNGRRGMLVFPAGKEGYGWKTLSLELKHALAGFSKAPVVVKGGGKGKEMGGQTRTYAEAARGGEASSRVAVQGGNVQILYNVEKEKNKGVAGEGHRVAGECHMAGRVGRGQVNDLGVVSLPENCVGEREGQNILFGMKVELAGVKEELAGLKRTIESLIGKVDWDLFLKRNLGLKNKGAPKPRINKGKIKLGMDLGRSRQAHPKLKWRIKMNGPALGEGPAREGGHWAVDPKTAHRQWRAALTTAGTGTSTAASQRR
ncbi:hypothetical protein I3760_14G113000 [Carya illinoinensis]|nr:hypothetical protein I3760_14G113000 [Carya illinoinensis]